jgi:hypothetical protein
MIESASFMSDFNCWTIAQMREAGVSEGDGLFILGYPLGQMSKGQRRAVARAGVVARIRDVFDDSTQPFLIDAHIFPGNSGGAVVTQPDVAALGDTQPIAAAMVIGILTDVQMHFADVRNLETGARFRIKTPAGLGSVQPMDRVFETIAEHRRLHPANATDAPSTVTP